MIEPGLECARNPGAASRLRRCGGGSLVALAGIALALGSGTGSARDADLVLRNAVVRTLDAATPRASAVAIVDGRLDFVGDEAGVAAHIGKGTRVLDLDGHTVLPGLQDSHAHPMSSGLWLARCRLGDATSVPDVHAAIRACDAARPGSGWLLGRGWRPENFPKGAPTRHELDRILPDRPAYLVTVVGDTAWVNSAALAAAGIDADTDDPPKGTIEREANGGAPSGILHGAALYMVLRHAPAPTEAEYREALRQVSALANGFGITAIIDASVDPSMLSAYRAADRAGELTVRVVATQRIDRSKGNAQVDDVVARAAHARGRRLRADAAKIFLDGEIDSHTAALLAPYADSPTVRGELYLEPQALDELVGKLDAAGIQVHVHAMGDRATRVALDAFERAARGNATRDRRHMLTHLELVDPADIPRFARLGVAANIQPAWAWRDERIAKVVEPLLGAQRARRLYPFGSLAASGATLVASSDWAATPLDPWAAMQVAATRRSLAGGSNWLPRERVPLHDLIVAYTLAGARIAEAESSRGSLVAGKSADLIVLDRDPYAVPVREIGKVRVLLTLLEGEVVHRASDFAWP